MRRPLAALGRSAAEGESNRTHGLNTLRAGQTGVRISGEARYFYLLRNVQTGSDADLAFHSTGTAILSRELSGQGMNLTTHLHLVPRLGMRGAMPLLRLYAFMAWRGKYFYVEYSRS